MGVATPGFEVDWLDVEGSAAAAAPERKTLRITAVSWPYDMVSTPLETNG
jgi:hypothetical protein